MSRTIKPSSAPTGTVRSSGAEDGTPISVTLPRDLPLRTFRPIDAAAPEALSPTPASKKDVRSERGGQGWASFWLGLFFSLTGVMPGMMLRLQPMLCMLAFLASPPIRRATRANASRLLGPRSSPRSRDRLARAMIASFYRFCFDMAQTARVTPEQLLEQVESIHGHDAFLRARALGRGTIVVTAHLGSFEVGLTLLAALEPKVHVVFRRDAAAQFENWRSDLRRRLGVIEAPIDEGWTIWMRLRDALARDELVVMQGDRVMSGQSGQTVPVLGGHISLPLGPIKLARVTRSPILPVFTVRTADGRIRFHIEEPIEVDPSGGRTNEPDAALIRIGNLIEKYLRQYPDQWLMLEPAWIEDQAVRAPETRE